MRGSDESISPRIYYTDPLAEAPADAVRVAASLGFYSETVGLTVVAPERNRPLPAV